MKRQCTTRLLCYKHVYDCQGFRLVEETKMKRLQDTLNERVWHYPYGIVYKAETPNQLYFRTAQDAENAMHGNYESLSVYDVWLAKRWVAVRMKYVHSATYARKILKALWFDNEVVGDDVDTDVVTHDPNIPGPKWVPEARGTSGFEFL